jgi:hypothetical protein
MVSYLGRNSNPERPEYEVQLSLDIYNFVFNFL